MLTAAAILALTASLATPAVTQVASTPPPETFLQPGDVIRIQIWGEPQLSGEFLVDAGGTVVLPMIGAWPVGEIPMDELAPRLVAAFQEELRNPSISILPLRRVFVLGDVARPSLYMIEPTSSLATTVALAGGPSPIGDLSKIRLVRNGEVVIDRISMEQAIDVTDLRSGDQIYVGRTSWVARNATYVIGIGFTLLSLGMQIF